MKHEVDRRAEVRGMIDFIIAFIFVGEVIKYRRGR